MMYQVTKYVVVRDRNIHASTKPPAPSSKPSDTAPTAAAQLVTVSPAPVSIDTVPVPSYYYPASS